MSFRPPAILLLLAVLGCAHGHLDPGTARIEGPVGHVEVVTVPDLPADRIERYRELDVSELTSAGVWQPTADVGVAVTVTNFRLRSAANAFWNGFLAGSDLLDGRIDILRGSAPAEQIAFKFSGNEDEYFKFSAAA